MSFARIIGNLVLFLLFSSCVYSNKTRSRYLTSKDSVTVLYMDGGGLRNIVSTVVLVEVEQSIKRYLLAHPNLLPGDAEINSVEDFDVDLVDYFDVMTGVSAGGWMALYLASRGGQGFARRVLDDPVIVEKYGFIPTGSAEGLRVFFREFGNVIIPENVFASSEGPPFNFSNPLSLGVSSAVSTTEGIESAMELFLGNATMADLDTSVIVPTFDLISGFTTLFVMNAFGDIPVTSSAKMSSRFSPRSPKRPWFSSNLQFDEGANYYLKDVAAATGALPIYAEAKTVSRVGNDTVEFLGIDGAYSVDSAELIAGFFAASENGLESFEKIAIISLGSGTVLSDWRPLANAGLTSWLQSSSTSLFLYSGGVTSNALLDYIYYSNPKTKPYQFLRINKAFPSATEEGRAIANGWLNISFMDTNQEIGQRIAEEQRESIDIFVRDFVFG